MNLTELDYDCITMNLECNWLELDSTFEAPYNDCSDVNLTEFNLSELN